MESDIDTRVTVKWAVRVIMGRTHVLFQVVAGFCGEFVLFVRTMARSNERRAATGDQRKDNAGSPCPKGMPMRNQRQK
jgi:hypothetical protein